MTDYIKKIFFGNRYSLKKSNKFRINPTFWFIRFLNFILEIVPYKFFQKLEFNKILTKLKGFL